MFSLLGIPNSRILLTAFLGLGVGYWLLLALMRGAALSSLDTVAMIPTATLLGAATLWAFFGLSFYWAPWRWLLRRIPSLQSSLYPDLNGTWKGKVSSNWTRIVAAREGNETDDVALHDVDIELKIFHSLFHLKVEAISAGKYGASRSFACTIFKDENSSRWNLLYLYHQENPNPHPTDSDAHEGAAKLKLEDTDTLVGHFWTKRQWHKAENTAGLVELTRISYRHTTGN